MALEYLPGREGDSLEQSMCRLRTDEEERAVDTSTVVRVLLGAGAREIRLDPDYKPFDLD